MKYLTSPELTARWSRQSGYFAVRKSAFELPEMIAYFEQFPQAGQAADLLQYTNAQWVLYRYAEVSQITAEIFEEVLVLGSKSPAEGMKELRNVSPAS